MVETMSCGSFGDDADDELVAVVDGEADLGAREGRVAVHEARRSVRDRTRVAGHTARRSCRTGSAGPRRCRSGTCPGAAGQAQLAGDRRAVVLEADRDGHPGADPGVAVEHRSRFHRQAVRRRDGRGGRQEQRGDQPEARQQAHGARGHAALERRQAAGAAVRVDRGESTATPRREASGVAARTSEAPRKLRGHRLRRVRASGPPLSYDASVP